MPTLIQIVFSSEKPAQRGGYTKDLTVTLGKMPEDVYQAMVSKHMKEEHVDVAAK